MLSGIKKDNGDNLYAVIDDLTKIRRKNIDIVQNKNSNHKK